MTRIETIQKSLSEAKATLYALKQAGANAEIIADAEARVRANQMMLNRHTAKNNE